MNYSFNGQVALVTGAGSGIGRAAAKLLAEQGARVALLGRTRSELAETAAAIQPNGDNTFIVEADISDYDAMETAVTQTIAKWGRLDIVFANAGINGVWAPIEKLDPEEWEKTVRNRCSRDNICYPGLPVAR